MNPDQARERASEYLNVEGIRGGDRMAFHRDMEQIAASLVALMPDLEPHAVFPLSQPPQTEQLVILGLKDGVLWRAHVDRHGEGESPAVAVTRFASDQWRVAAIEDGMKTDANARTVHRAWALNIGDELFTFKTDHYLGTGPDSIEQFGRALAAAEGWEVSDLRLR